MATGSTALILEVAALKAELAQVKAKADALAKAGKDCADDLEAEIESRRTGELPRRIARDLETVLAFRQALAAWEDGKA
ncbi:MAG: hypothetical protein KGL39_58270 [Patescibacteria group bacterium]|nr:hypothetical protein [Patescibacteria group bacterium]